jgi:hypothetical protein
MSSNIYFGRNQVKKEAFRFNDLRDIQIGYGRIIWAESLDYRGRNPNYVGRNLLAGWVLPGGERTQDKDIAERAAMAIDDQFQRKQKY